MATEPSTLAAPHAVTTARAPPIARRSFVFGSMDDAQSFMRDVQQEGAAAQSGLGFGGSRSTYSLFADLPGFADRYHGQMFRSTHGRELRVYGYQARVTRSDREYLFHRDPTAAMFVEKPFADMWNGFPQTYIPEVDAYFAEQMALGLLAGFQASYQEYYQEGGGLLVLETTGDMTKRLKRGERPLAWTFVPSCNVIENEEGEDGYLLAGSNNVDRLLDHGIEYISFYATERDRERNTPTKIHGSRIIVVNLDPRMQKWWRTPNVPVNRIYDTLWELRDIIFSRTRAHFQGDPIVVDVDISKEALELLNTANQSAEERTELSQQVEQSIIDYNAGAKSSFAPVLGFKMRRLGAAQLPDPKEDVMMLSSRLAHGGYFPVKMVLASTKGSSDVGDQDILIYAGNLQNVRNTWGYKHLAKALLMGQTMGVNGLRMQGNHDLPGPQDLAWPLLRPLSPRDAAFTEKTDAAIYREAQEASLVPPARLRRKFSEDSRYPIPLWLAARGRGIDGKSKDPKPASGGGADAMGIEDAVQAEVKRIEDRKQMAEWAENGPKTAPNPTGDE